MKMHLNSTILTDEAVYFTLDIKNFYLNSELDEYKYILLDMHLMSEEFIVEYKRCDIEKMEKH